MPPSEDNPAANECSLSETERYTKPHQLTVYKSSSVLPERVVGPRKTHQLKHLWKEWSQAMFVKNKSTKGGRHLIAFLESCIYLSFCFWTAL